MLDSLPSVVAITYALVYSLLLLFIVETRRGVITGEKSSSKTTDFLILIPIILFFFLVWIVYWLVSSHPLDYWYQAWAIIYIIAQLFYLYIFAVMFYFFSLKVNWVDSIQTTMLTTDQMPLIVLAYPVLHEDEGTMHSTMITLSRIDYPRDKYRVIVIPNSNDTVTIASLKRLQIEFPFLEILEVPPTHDHGWNTVWQAWDSCPFTYWWHTGKTKGVQGLPSKKTRQLIYLFYTLINQIGTSWVLDYIDADSLTPPNHFKLAAVGLQKYDVLQSTNVVGNPLDTLSTSLHAYDHMTWDGNLYPHMSANGKHPYYMLGKGLFYKASDLYNLGSFNPWITIEDPEVGMRLWANGKRLGIIAEPLIEEVPQHFFMGGIIQRNRWMCGFFQTMGAPLKSMGMKFWARQKARLNLVPVLSQLVNIIGLPTGAYALYRFINHAGDFPLWVIILSLINIAFYLSLISGLYVNVWKRTGYVLNKKRDRIIYMLRINPVFLFAYWILWCIPIFVGFGMYILGMGKTWDRTEKVDSDRNIAEKM